MKTDLNAFEEWSIIFLKKLLSLYDVQSFPSYGSLGSTFYRRTASIIIGK